MVEDRSDISPSQKYDAFLPRQSTFRPYVCLVFLFTAFILIIIQPLPWSASCSLVSLCLATRSDCSVTSPSILLMWWWLVVLSSLLLLQLITSSIYPFFHMRPISALLLIIVNVGTVTTGTLRASSEKKRGRRITSEKTRPPLLVALAACPLFLLTLPSRYTYRPTRTDIYSHIHSL